MNQSSLASGLLVNWKCSRIRRAPHAHRVILAMRLKTKEVINMFEGYMTIVSNRKDSWNKSG